MLKLIGILLTIIISFYNHASEHSYHAPEYIMGCTITKNTVATGVFKLSNDNELQLICSHEAQIQQISDFPSHIASVVKDIEAEHKLTITRACFAGPGTTNATKQILYPPHSQFKTVDCTAIKQQIYSLDEALIVNDFESLGFGIQDAIEKKQFSTLHQGKPQDNEIQAIIGAGNGLGTSLMVFDKARETYMSQAINWSFVDFSAQTKKEVKLLQFLQETTGSKSWGKVLGSTGGIVALYQFLHRNKEINETKLEEYKKNYLQCFADSKDDKKCAEAVALYMHLYARLAQNVALLHQPRNGLYITNTIAEKHQELFDATFMKEYLNTGNEYLDQHLEKIPVYLVTAEKERLQMHGAALYCLAHTKSKTESMWLSQ